ncbi:pantetheine-phosphate adenylyltransferase [Streptobacillus moniliformis]|uniref:Phosphopantetheine adenylyltransferase n=1 Tax=Streptobacillus moniliformis (strain ATCC 14647 / DSM 12112 / NCTC 10651 / 9901) TaxID=519441 RepID=D1AY71_STRM9|nr:pantetheine-phosphate adenylyltransferase [Streptobacillus moniliformis]ACZ01247.1 pantetheine-phosphate adenylyltransferase [Streptobacillus moniliformis DSM 12112]AVL42395.1 pantetheine-phosphate adenylyltransferase [Streptobacillus moniliformis]QXW65992.1 pantetheine-phosphate adenylyltransferase [Streptobacillus moniliformis]SQA13598.1 Phosphopantetheine adenylyltransferase [Streptobacillus moniliformis]
MNIKVIYPGSFDPITKGHLDIIKRSAKLFDELIIGVFINSSKKEWFSIDERVKLIEKVLKEENINNTKVVKCSGLLVEYIKNENIDILVRGLRAVSDYEYELQVTLTNEALTSKPFETIFLTASREYLYLSSSIVKEIALNGGKLTGFLPNAIISDINEKVNMIKNGK